MACSPPPKKSTAWHGPDGVLAGAITSVLRPKDGEMLTMACAKPSRPEIAERATLRALESSPSMLALAKNLYSLHGPVCSFRKGQIYKVFLDMSVCQRARDKPNWATCEMLKFVSFCTGLRALFRQNRAPQALCKLLDLDAEKLISVAKRLRSTEFGDDEPDEVGDRSRARRVSWQWVSC
jgi:hypothetical protein